MIVAVGVTLFAFAPNTEPMPLSMLKMVAVPPDKVHDKVTGCPCVVGFGDAEKVEITGAGGLTVIVIDLVAVPVAFVAVSV